MTDNTIYIYIYDREQAIKRSNNSVMKPQKYICIYRYIDIFIFICGGGEIARIYDTARLSPSQHRTTHLIK